MKKIVGLFLTLILCSCSNPIQSLRHNHTYSSDWTYNDEYHWHAATCEHKDEVISKAKHSFSEWIIDEDADIGHKGSKHRNCTVCPYVQTAEIPATPHDHIPDDPVIENNVDPTCTTPGSYDEVVYCLLCEQELSRRTITVNATGHQHTEQREGDKKEATCTEDGYVTILTYCLDCKQIVSENKQTIEATGHEYGDMDFVSAASLEGLDDDEFISCTDDYSLYGYFYCKKCGELLFDGYKDFPPAGHKYEVIDSGSATYEAAGYIKYKCSRCGDIYTEQTDPKLEHHYSEEWTTNSIYHYHACTDEGYEDLKKDEAKHEFVSSFVAPTNEADGYMYRKCSVCNYETKTYLTKAEYDERVGLGMYPDVSGSTAYYGLYPDNLITDANRIAELDEAKLAAHKYGQEAIFKYNGKYYRRCAAQNTSNGYPNTTAGEYYYFEMNRIKWTIVENYDDGSALLLSSAILDAHSYDDDSCKYASSNLRTYINKWVSRSPIDLMFGTSGCTYLMKQTVLNSGPTVFQADQYNQEWYQSETTEDYLSIPSIPELTNWASAIGKDKVYVTSATSYAHAMNSDLNHFAPNGNDRVYYSTYWTRTPQSTNYVKGTYGRWSFYSDEPNNYPVGVDVTACTGIRYLVRVQLDVTKPVNFESISALLVQ